MNVSFFLGTCWFPILAGVTPDKLGWQVVQRFRHINTGRFFHFALECGRDDTIASIILHLEFLRPHWKPNRVRPQPTGNKKY